MSALAMILTAAMMVPGDGSGWEKTFAEVVAAPAPLDLRGEWKGRVLVKDKENESEVEVTITNGRMQVQSEGRSVGGDLEVLFNREGKVRFKWATKTCHGIYRQEGDRFVLCLQQDDKYGAGYPTSFRAGTDQTLSIFHRVKPGK